MAFEADPTGARVSNARRNTAKKGRTGCGDDWGDLMGGMPTGGGKGRVSGAAAGGAALGGGVQAAGKGPGRYMALGGRCMSFTLRAPLTGDVTDKGPRIARRKLEVPSSGQVQRRGKTGNMWANCVLGVFTRAATKISRVAWE